MIRVAVQYASDCGAGTAAEVPEGGIRKLVRACMAELAAEGEVTVRLVEAPESSALNRRWRGIDRPTNVLAFPADRSLGEIGDIVICLPLVRSEAQERGCAPAAHLAHLVVHGCLHLAGHDHQEPKQAEIMESLESRLLAQAGWPDPWAGERA